MTKVSTTYNNRPGCALLESDLSYLLHGGDKDVECLRNQVSCPIATASNCFDVDAEHCQRFGISRTFFEVASSYMSLRVQSLGDVKQIVDNIPEATIVTMSGANEIFHVNQEWEKLFGYSLNIVIGRSHRFLQGALTDSRTLQDLGKCMAAGRPAQAVVVNYKSDGTPFYNFLQVAQVLDDSIEAKTLCYLGILTEIKIV